MSRFWELYVRKLALEESGDLANIIPFGFTGPTKIKKDDVFKFNIDPDHRVEVVFENITDRKNEFSTYDIKHCNSIINLAYLVNDEASKHKNFDIVTLNRVLKTVKNIFLEWLEQGNSPDVIIITSALSTDIDSDKDDETKRQEHIKYKIYKEVLKHMISDVKKFNYTEDRIIFEGIEMIALKHDRIFLNNK